MQGTSKKGMVVNTDLLTDVIIVIKKKVLICKAQLFCMKLDTFSTNLVSSGRWKRRMVTWLWSRSVPILQFLASMGFSTAAETWALVSQWAQLQDSWLPKNIGWERIPSPAWRRCWNASQQSWHTSCREETSQLKLLHLQIKNGILAKSSNVFF